VDPLEQETLQVLPLGEDEAGVSMALCEFPERRGELFVLVGVARPPEAGQTPGGAIYVWSVNQGRLALEHKTLVEHPPRALASFQGRVLAGLGGALRCYDLGKKKMLKKSELRAFASPIVSICVDGARAFVGETAGAISLVSLDRLTNALVLYADDQRPRWVTAATLLDADTVAGADRFGNVFVSRLALDDAEELEQRDASAHALASASAPASKTAAARCALQEVAHFNVGEVVCSMTKTTLASGGTEAILYSTIHGGIGALQPLAIREEVELLTNLEMLLRGAAGAREAAGGFDHASLVGRDHLAFRSATRASKGVVDGDLCETFSLLPTASQARVAAELDRSPEEVLRKLDEVRGRLL